jgi:arginyl-tRNA synthetase
VSSTSTTPATRSKSSPPPSTRATGSSSSEESAVPFPEDGYPRRGYIALAERFRAEKGDGWLDRPEAERHAADGGVRLSVNLPKMKTDLARYKINYDEWFCESALHRSGYVADTVDALTQRGYYL